MVEEKQYKISEMTKIVNVEAHVLRYWEEELQLPIKRNELGHRYYTKDDVERFLEIKKLKEKGIQLKGIRSMLDITSDVSDVKLPGTSDVKLSAGSDVKLPSVEVETSTLVFEEEKDQKAYRLQLLLKGLVKEAVLESNVQLAEDIKDSVMKEMDYQFRVMAEEQEQRQKKYSKQQEEYFDKLDHMIQENMQFRKKKKAGLFHLTAK